MNTQGITYSRPEHSKGTSVFSCFCLTPNSFFSCKYNDIEQIVGHSFFSEQKKKHEREWFVLNMLLSACLGCIAVIAIVTLQSMSISLTVPLSILLTVMLIASSIMFRLPNMFFLPNRRRVIASHLNLPVTEEAKNWIGNTIAKYAGTEVIPHLHTFMAHKNELRLRDVVNTALLTREIRNAQPQ